jgi:hypothetical protein
MTDDAALAIAKLIPCGCGIAVRGRSGRHAARDRSGQPMRHCSAIAASRRALPTCVFSAEYFPLWRGNRRFHGIAPARHGCGKTRFCLMPFIVKAAMLPVRRIPAARFPHHG